LRPLKANEIPHNMLSKPRDEGWPDGAFRLPSRVEREGGLAPTDLAEWALSLSPPLSKLNIGQALEAELHQPVLYQMGESIPAVHSRVVGFATRRSDQDFYVKRGLTR
jgi:hypothetical protein